MSYNSIVIEMGSESSNSIPEIRKTVILSAPIEKVWKAISTPEGLEAWWMPGDIEPVRGKKFLLHTTQFGDSSCVVTELDPPHLLGFDWDDDWHLTFYLKEIGERSTELTLVHSGWIKGKKNRFGLLHEDVHEVMDDGWSRIIREGLPKYVEKK